MPVSDEPAMLLAIAAEPDENTPRLAMADWFQEVGQADRAEFVRVQIELADQRARKYAASPENDLRQTWLEEREKELLVAHPEWTTYRCPLCRGAGRHVVDADTDSYSPCFMCDGSGDLLATEASSGCKCPRLCTFTRGFLTSVSCGLYEVADWVAHASGDRSRDWFDRRPWGRAVTAAFPTLTHLVPFFYKPSRSISGGGIWNTMDDSGTSVSSQLPRPWFLLVGRYHESPEAAIGTLTRLTCDTARLGVKAVWERRGHRVPVLRHYM